MNQARVLSLVGALLAGALFGCDPHPNPLPEATRTSVLGPSAGVAKSADGLFELRFALGALSEPVEVTIRTVRDLEVANNIDAQLPVYEVSLDRCAVTRPELVTAALQRPDGLRWRGRLALGSLGEGTLPAVITSRLVEGAVEAREVLRCGASGARPHKETFGLTAVLDEACVWARPESCGPCAVCDATDAACQQPSSMVCAEGRCVAPDEIRPGACGPSLDPFPGWDAAPGSGSAYIMSEFRIAPQGVGFDVDNTCRGPGDCVDNSMWQFGELLNDQIRQFLLAGDLLYALEFTGQGSEPLSEPTLTARFYVVSDADDPFYPANNLWPVTGEEGCCEFLVEPSSVHGYPPQAIARAAARAQAGRLETLTPMTLDLRLHPTVDDDGWTRLFTYPLQHAYLTLETLPGSVGVLRGRLGGVVSVEALASISNPLCVVRNQFCARQIPQSTMLDIFASAIQPDIDLDRPRDGLERLEIGVNGRVARCFDGSGLQVPPLVAEEPWTCALDPRLADGYSVAFEFTAVPARLVGIKER